MAEYLKPTISPSELVSVISGERYYGGMTPEARIGIEKHKNLLGDMVSQRTPLIPEPLRRGEFAPPLRVELTAKREIANGLLMGGRVDLKTEQGKVLELKSGGQKQGRHMLQAVCECFMVDSNDGWLYYMGSRQLLRIRGGGEKFWESIGNMSVLARMMLDNEVRIKELKWRDPKRNELGNKNIKLLAELMKISDTVMPRLTREFEVVN